jgi:hypothetical protein
MDIILGMLGIALLWLLGSCFSMIGIGLVLTFYSKITPVFLPFFYIITSFFLSQYIL